jgi:NADPH:quinone reductase-like Zn-dependent oxidoreductase
LLTWEKEVGVNFNLELAEQITFAAVDRLVSMSPPSGTAILLNLGDMFHADNANNRTPASGNQLDVDGRFEKIATTGILAMVRCVQRMLERHALVIVRINKGNHDPHQAAMLKVNPATAWRLLHGFTHLQPGEWIVQNLGNSAVGRCVIQLAHSLGIHTLSFVRRPEVSAELRALGADHVFTDDETGLTAARQALGGANASLAFNAVGGDSALRLMKLLRESATHITYGAMGRKPVTIPNGLLIFRDIQVRGLWVSRWIENAPPADVQDTYDHLSALVAAGKLIQPIDSTYPLDSYATALARLDAPDRSGKILCTP